MVERILLKTEEKKSINEVAEFLSLIALKLKARENIVLRQGTNEITLQIPEQLVLEVKVEEKTKLEKKKLQLEIELEWDVNGESKGLELG